MDILQHTFGRYQNEKVTEITLVNDNGVEVSCLTMGAIWHRFAVPEDDGTKKNLLLSFDGIDGYYSNNQNICKSIGRVAGRIKGASYDLNGKHYQLPANENGNTLHGGPNGFSTLNWNYSTSISKNGISVIFQRKIDEEIDGFPGNILATIIYTLNNNNRVTIAYSAMNGKEDTLFNPTCHAYFNLSDRRDLATHEMQINSTGILDVNDQMIPTGEVLSVANTPYDFRDFSNVALAVGKAHGLDTAYVVNGPGQGTKPVAVLRDQESGRQITINSDRNGLVVYTPEEITGQNMSFSRDHGEPANKNEGIALECQMLPDAIHQDNFGDIVLPRYSKQTYRFSFTYNRIKKED